MKRAAPLILIAALCACSPYARTVDEFSDPPTPQADLAALGHRVATLSPLRAVEATLAFDHGLAGGAAVFIHQDAGLDLDLTEHEARTLAYAVSPAGEVRALPAPIPTRAERFKRLPTASPGRFAFTYDDQAYVLDGERWAQLPLPSPAPRAIALYSATRAAAISADGLPLGWDGERWAPLSTPPAVSPYQLGPWSDAGALSLVYSPEADTICALRVDMDTRAALGAPACLDTPFVFIASDAMNGVWDDFQVAVRTTQYRRLIHVQRGVPALGEPAIDELPAQPGYLEVGYNAGTATGSDGRMEISAIPNMSAGASRGWANPNYFVYTGNEAAGWGATAQRIFTLRFDTRDARRKLYIQITPLPLRAPPADAIAYPAVCDFGPNVLCTSGERECVRTCPVIPNACEVVADSPVCGVGEIAVEPLEFQGVVFSGQLTSVAGAGSVRLEPLDEGGVSTSLAAPDGFFSFDVTPMQRWRAIFEAPDSEGRVEPRALDFTTKERFTSVNAELVHLSQGRFISADEPTHITHSGGATIWAHGGLWHVVRAGDSPHALQIDAIVPTPAVITQPPLILPGGAVALVEAVQEQGALLRLSDGQRISALPGTPQLDHVRAARQADCALIPVKGRFGNVWCWDASGARAYSPNIDDLAARVDAGEAALTDDGDALILYSPALGRFERIAFRTGERESLPSPTLDGGAYVLDATIPAHSGQLVVYRSHRADDLATVRAEAVWRDGQAWRALLLTDSASALATSSTQPVVAWIEGERLRWFDARVGQIVEVGATSAPLADSVIAARDALVWRSAEGLHMLSLGGVPAPLLWPGSWPVVKSSADGQLAAHQQCEPMASCRVIHHREGVTRTLTVTHGERLTTLFGALERSVSASLVDGQPELLRVGACVGERCEPGGDELLVAASRPPFYPLSWALAAQHEAVLGAWGAACVLYARDRAQLGVEGAPGPRGWMCAR